MPWFKVDDGFYDHPKVIELSLSAVGLWTLCGSYSAKQLTDGRVTHRTVSRIGGASAHVAELLDSGLWIALPHNDRFDYQFKDWEHYQPLKEAVVSEREAARIRMTKVRAKRKGQVEGGAEKPAGNIEVGSGEQTSERSEDVRLTPTQSQPDPVPAQSQSPRKPSGLTPEMIDGLFEAAWRVWPKKVDKKAAKQKFTKALGSFKGREAELVNVISRHAKAHREHTEPQFVRGLAVWLNQESWNNPLPGTEGNPGTAAPGKTPPKDPNAWMQPGNLPKRVDPGSAA